MAEKTLLLKLFDDLYYMGGEWVGAYVLDTEEGLVLLDATERTDAYERFLLPLQREFGLEDKPVRAILLTHGHYDHYLGAPEIAKQTGCPVALTERDASYMVICEENKGNKPPVMPHITRFLNDGDALSFGSHTVWVQLAPGHTPGCVNFIADAHRGAETHRFVLMGGAAVFGPGNYAGEYPYGAKWAVDQALLFAGSCTALWRYCRENGVDVFLSPHPESCGLFEQAERGDFVTGREQTLARIRAHYHLCVESAERFAGMAE